VRLILPVLGQTTAGRGRCGRPARGVISFVPADLELPLIWPIAVTPMQFSEASAPWRTIPPWAAFLIRFGHSWVRHGENRRIAVISLPGDSAAAGLIALGAMRKRLEEKDANDLARHFTRLKGLSTPHRTGVVLRHRSRTGRWVFDSIDACGNMWLRIDPPQDSLRMLLLQTNASDWRFDGEAPVRTHMADQIPYTVLYNRLIDDVAPVFAPNLSRSESAICIAGRTGGGAATLEAIDAVRLRADGQEAKLGELLTVQGWLRGTASRVTFFNTRTDAFDRESGTPAVVVADGHAAFLRVIDNEDFSESDVLAVIQKTADREQLEAVGSKIANMSQWYSTIPQTALDLQALPRGMDLLLLARR
jgi:hypothetical protein